MRMCSIHNVSIQIKMLIGPIVTGIFMIVWSFCYLIPLIAARTPDSGELLSIRTTIIGGCLAFAAFIVALNLAVTRVLVTNPIRKAIEVAVSMSDGNFQVKVEAVNADEAGQLLTAMKIISEKITPILRDIDSSSRQMKQSSLQVTEISSKIAEASRLQSDSSSNVSTATEELRQISEHVRSLADSATSEFTVVDQIAGSGLDAVQANRVLIDQTVSVVNSAAVEAAVLKQVGEKIHAIIASITDIADQTNLLALNAAIEAARAGEQGRGFAVVADEVRSLAHKTTQETVEIRRIIDELTGQVDKTLTTMSYAVTQVGSTAAHNSDTARVIEQMVTSVRGFSKISQEISRVSGNQVNQLTAVHQSTDTLFAVIKESSALIGITATISTDLVNVTNTIADQVKIFSFDHSQVAPIVANDKRRHARYYCRLLIRSTCLAPPVVVFGLGDDVSKSGMRLRIPKETLLPVGAELQLSIKSPCESYQEYHAKAPVEIRAKVIRIDPHGFNNHYGLEFVGLTSAQSSAIDSFHSGVHYQ